MQKGKESKTRAKAGSKVKAGSNAKAKAAPTFDDIDESTSKFTSYFLLFLSLFSNFFLLVLDIFLPIFFIFFQ